MNIDELFKNKLQNGSSPLGKELWQKIDNKLPNGTGQSFFHSLSLTTKIIGGCVASAVIVVASVVAINNNAHVENEITKTNETNQVIENTISTTTLQQIETISTIEKQKAQNNNLSNNNEELFFEIDDDVAYISKENNYTPAPPQNIDNNINSEITSTSPQTKKNIEEKLIVDTIEQKTQINILIPNYITPNGDEINDYFEIKNIELYPDNFLVIRDRKGKRIYGQHNYKNDFCGENCAAGTYFYILSVRVNNRVQQFSGTLEIIK